MATEHRDVGMGEAEEISAQDSVANNGVSTTASVSVPHQHVSSAADAIQGSGHAMVPAPEKKPGGITGKGFMPGRSGNPSGRPRKLPMSERYGDILETRLPNVARLMLEKRLQIRIKPSYTFGDAIALMIGLTALGMVTNVRLDATREMREAVEGKATQRAQVVDDPIPDDPEELRDKVMAGLIKVAVKRARMYNMDLPALSDMADEAGVDLGIPRGDKPKPE